MTQDTIGLSRLPLAAGIGNSLAAAALAVLLGSGARADTHAPQRDGRVASQYKVNGSDAYWRTQYDPKRINSAGTVVGSSIPGSSKPVRRVVGQGLEMLPGLAQPWQDGFAVSINDEGDAVGWVAEDPKSPDTGRAVRWPAQGGVIDLGALLPAGLSRATGINAAGEVVGYYAPVITGPVEAVVWSADRVPRFLPRPPEIHGMNASQINDLGSVAGDRADFFGDYCGRGAFFWSAETGVLTFDGVCVVAGLNNQNQVVGHTRGGDAVFWEPALGPQTQRLPPLQKSRPCEAKSINDAGLVVGWCSPRKGRGPKPVAWERVDGEWHVVDLSTRVKPNQVFPWGAYYMAQDVTEDGRILLNEFSAALRLPVSIIATPVEASP